MLDEQLNQEVVEETEVNVEKIESKKQGFKDLALGAVLMGVGIGIAWLVTKKAREVKGLDEESYIVEDHENSDKTVNSEETEEA